MAYMWRHRWPVRKLNVTWWELIWEVTTDGNRKERNQAVTNDVLTAQKPELKLLWKPFTRSPIAFPLERTSSETLALAAATQPRAHTMHWYPALQQNYRLSPLLSPSESLSLFLEDVQRAFRALPAGERVQSTFFGCQRWDKSLRWFFPLSLTRATVGLHAPFPWSLCIEALLFADKKQTVPQSHLSLKTASSFFYPEEDLHTDSSQTDQPFPSNPCTPTPAPSPSGRLSCLAPRHRGSRVYSQWSSRPSLAWFCDVPSSQPALSPRTREDADSRSFFWALRLR